MKLLIANMTATRPEGWNQPLNWQARFLTAATRARMVSPPVLLDLCDAVYGPKPIIHLPRWREGKDGPEITVVYGSSWDYSNRDALSTALLWQVERVLLDGKPFKVREPHRFSESWRGSYPGSLTAGDHEVVVEVQCAYVDPDKLIGLTVDQLPVSRWPEARKRWKQSVSSPLRVHTADEPLVALVTDPARSPGPNGGVRIDRLVVQAGSDDGKKKIILKVEFPSRPGPSLPLSYDAAMVIEGQPNRVSLGPVWVVRSATASTSSLDQREAIIDGLDPSIRRVDIVLTPNPVHVEQFPEVSEIWGKTVTLGGVPLERLDL